MAPCRASLPLAECTAGPEVSVVFDHNGAVDHAMVEHLLGVAEQASLTAGDPVALRKRLFTVLVEGLENMHHHGHEDFRDRAFALLTAGPDGYRMMLGNVLPVATAALLAQRVGILNEMREEDLKELHLQLLSDQGRTGHGGAGIGLLTMARKSTAPLRVHSRPMGGDLACFALELHLRRP